MSENDRITLNIGGTLFQTTRGTLIAEPATMLSAMFGGEGVPPQPDEDGSYFIDRDPKHFRFILNYLRGNKLKIPYDPIIRRELLEEVKFYQILGLIESVQQTELSYIFDEIHRSKFLKLRHPAIIERFTWHIEDMIGYLEEIPQNNYIESPIFPAGNLHWCLRMYPNGRMLQYTSDSFSVYLRLVSSMEHPIPENLVIEGSFTVVLHNQDPTNDVVQRTGCGIFKWKGDDGLMWGWQAVMNLEILRNPKYGWLDRNGTFTLSVESIEVKKLSIHIRTPSLDPDFIPQEEQNIAVKLLGDI
eukprot:TRINITY_DN5110_c0_g1_i3.p1 TRINITY_DN5110_c0_g1~~TRINITY_DN5110_c0_g1_i3.p1  ORF type:complete len:301 (-),score=45.14 TRINITY_DN5110_c0_g1_i3:42-944(-)